MNDHIHNEYTSTMKSLTMIWLILMLTAFAMNGYLIIHLMNNPNEYSILAIVLSFAFSFGTIFTVTRSMIREKKRHTSYITNA